MPPWRIADLWQKGSPDNRQPFPGVLRTIPDPARSLVEEFRNRKHPQPPASACSQIERNRAPLEKPKRLPPFHPARQEAKEIFCRRCAKRLVADNDEITSAAKFIQPVVHHPDQTPDSRSFVAEKLADGSLRERSVWITSGHLNVKRNEAVSRIAYK